MLRDRKGASGRKGKRERERDWKTGLGAQRGRENRRREIVRERCPWARLALSCLRPPHHARDRDDAATLHQPYVVFIAAGPSNTICDLHPAEEYWSLTMGGSVGSVHVETLASNFLVYYFSFYILCRMCLFWEFHNKMTVIYHYQPLYHLVNKRPLTFSLSFPPSQSGSQISVLVPPPRLPRGKLCQKLNHDQLWLSG